MKILLVHNFYGSSAPSGENMVYLAEKALLERNGHEVIEFVRYSDAIRAQGAWGAVKGALSTPWNPYSHAAVLRIIERENPDLMHVHNVFPMISPSIFSAAAARKVAVVLTLHNYRTVCAAGIPMRDGVPCTKCLEEKSVWPAIRYGCYRKSRLATLPLAASISIHRKLGTWLKHVDAFVALTEFQRDMLVRSGLPSSRIHIKPHFYEGPPCPKVWDERENKVVFVGRLREEKGVCYLVEAWLRWGMDVPVLEVIGDGPQRNELERLAKPIGNRVRFLGQLPFAETQERIAASRLLVLPSICFEGFPMVIREAYALGVPVAASRLGSIQNLVEEGGTGSLFESGSSEELLGCVKGLWKNQQELKRMAFASRAKFECSYTSATNHRRLMDIYDAAIERRRSK